MMRRRRRRRASWIWADRFLFQCNAGNSAVNAGHLLLPPSRVNWLCDTAAVRSSITVKAILLWLDFNWVNEQTAAERLPDCDIYVMKTAADENVAEGETTFDPFVQPQPPASTTDWSSFPSDGLDPFLWTHHIRGLSPPNSAVATYNGGTPPGFAVANQTPVVIAAAGVDGPFAVVCRTFSVRAEWQPDVIIKTKRRLLSNEGLMIGLRTPAASSPVTCQLTVNTRILAG